MLVSLGEMVKKRRDELGITQHHLAEIADISVNTLYKIERGQANPSIKILQKIADVLGMQIMMQVVK